MKFTDQERNNISKLVNHFGDRLAPMTYKKLREFGYDESKWANMTQEQANRIINQKEYEQIQNYALSHGERMAKLEKASPEEKQAERLRMHAGEAKSQRIRVQTPEKFANESGMNVNDLSVDGHKAKQVYFTNHSPYVGLELDNGKYYVMGARYDRYVDDLYDMLDMTKSRR